MSDDPDRTVTRPRRKDSAKPPDALALRVTFPFHCTGIVELPRKGELVIGRKTHDARFDDPTVSRHHLTLRARGLGVEATDQNSRNGTWLDGTRLEGRAFAAPETVIRLGDVIAIVQAPEGDDESVDQNEIFGDSPRVRALRRMLGRLGPGRAPVLLLGETGTGKEHVAREIARLSGRGPFVALNCAGLTRELADSQLFGHRRGAFTGAVEAREGLFRTAHEGTLFLDEVAELAPEVQSKLLRVLETGSVQPLGQDERISTDVRVIAATHPDLAQRVAEGRFRRDLYARLSMAEIQLPALRERRGDIPQWAQRFDARWCASEGGEPLQWSADAIEALLLQPWPENLRGIDRAVYRLRCTIEGRAVEAADVKPQAQDTGDREKRSEPLPDIPTKEELERVLIANDGSVRATARHFGRDRRQIYRWIEAHGLEETRGRR